MAAAALFDWDGTLLDSREVILSAWHTASEARIGRRYPATPAEEELVFTRPGSELFSALTLGDVGEHAAFVTAFQTAYEDGGSGVRTFPGIPELLGTLRDAGVRVGVVTSKARRRFSADARHAGVDALIDGAVCAEDVTVHKPDPGPVLAALAALGVEPADAVMVGDTVVDIAAGLAGGVTSLGVAWGAAGPAPLHDAGARAVASDAAALAQLILSAVHEHDSRRVTTP